MVKPDMELVTETSYRVFFRGRIWDINFADGQWAISRNMEVFHRESSVGDAVAWLAAQAVT
jgi:hypothetical protein